MTSTTIPHDSPHYPIQLRTLTKPPQQLYTTGVPLPELMQRRRLAVVGSRSITPYGKAMVRQLVEPLAAQGVVIISGLAYGVDAAAHQAALHAGGTTLAVLPSPLSAVAPTGNEWLARNIIKQGGALISTYAEQSVNYRYNFVERNEYVAALSEAVLIIEGATSSGTRRTVDFAKDIGVPLLAVPGNVTSPLSALPNELIRDGCRPIITAQDIFDELGFGVQLDLSLRRGDTAAEQQLLDLIAEGITDTQALFTASKQPIHELNLALSALEIAGKIQPAGGGRWALA